MSTNFFFKLNKDGKSTIHPVTLKLKKPDIEWCFDLENYTSVSYWYLAYIFLCIIFQIISVILDYEVLKIVLISFSSASLICIYHINKLADCFRLKAKPSSITLRKIIYYVNMIFAFMAEEIFIESFNELSIDFDNLQVPATIFARILVLYFKIIIIYQINQEIRYAVFVLGINLAFSIYYILENSVWTSGRNRTRIKITFASTFFLLETIICYLRDKSRKMRFEENFDLISKDKILQQTFNNLNTGLLIIDRKGKIFYKNKFTEQLSTSIYEASIPPKPKKQQKRESFRNLHTLFIMNTECAKLNEATEPNAPCMGGSLKKKNAQAHSIAQTNNENHSDSNIIYDSKQAIIYPGCNNDLILHQNACGTKVRSKRGSLIKPSSLSDLIKERSDIDQVFQDNLVIKVDFFKNLCEISEDLPQPICDLMNSLHSDEDRVSVNSLLKTIVDCSDYFDDSMYFGVLKIEKPVALPEGGKGLSNATTTSLINPQEPMYNSYEVSIKVVKQINDTAFIEMFLKDITKYKQYEEVKESIKSKTTFMAKIAHEFKNPLICIGELTDQISETLNELNEIKANAKALKKNSSMKLLSPVPPPRFSKSEIKAHAKLSQNNFWSLLNNQEVSYPSSRGKKTIHLSHLSVIKKKFDKFRSNTEIAKKKSITSSLNLTSNTNNKNQENDCQIDLDDKTVADLQMKLKIIRSLSVYIITLVFDFEVLAKKESSSEIKPIIGKFNLKKEIYFLSEISTVLLNKSSLGVKFLSEFDPQLPKFIHSDYLRIRQIVINLISNSIKFTNSGYIKLKIRKIKEMNRHQLQFTVEDSGTGIDDPNKLFSQSFKHTGHNNQYGTGLGLMIVKDLCSCLGGKIRYEVNSPKGSRFIATLPYKEDEECNDNIMHSRLGTQTEEFPNSARSDESQGESNDNNSFSDSNNSRISFSKQSETNREKQEEEAISEKLEITNNKIKLKSRNKGGILKQKLIALTNTNLPTISDIKCNNTKAKSKFAIETNFTYNMSTPIKEPKTKANFKFRTSSFIRKDILNLDDTMSTISQKSSKQNLNKFLETVELRSTDRRSVDFENFDLNFINSKFRDSKEEKGSQIIFPILQRSDSEKKITFGLCRDLQTTAEGSQVIKRSSLKKRTIKGLNKIRFDCLPETGDLKVNKKQKDLLDRRKSAKERIKSDMLIFNDIINTTEKIDSKGYLITKTQSRPSPQNFNIAMQEGSTPINLITSINCKRSVFNCNPNSKKETGTSRRNSAGAPKKITMIVVDDEKIIRQCTTKLIEKWVHEWALTKGLNTELTIIEASDGIECLYSVFCAIHNDFTIDYILTDDSMKYMCGSESAAILQSLINQKKFDEINVCVVSAYDIGETKKRYQYSCVKEVFSKPLNFIQLDRLKMLK